MKNLRFSFLTRHNLHNILYLRVTYLYYKKLLIYNNDFSRHREIAKEKFL